MAQEKKYLPLGGKVRTFDNGGEIYSLFGKSDELIKFIKENTNSNGYFNFDVNKQKNDSSKLSVSLNTFEPKTSGASKDDLDSGLPF